MGKGYRNVTFSLKFVFRRVTSKNRYCNFPQFVVLYNCPKGKGQNKIRVAIYRKRMKRRKENHYDYSRVLPGRS